MLFFIFILFAVFLLEKSLITKGGYKNTKVHGRVITSHYTGLSGEAGVSVK